MSLNANDLIPERVQELIRINSEMLEMEYIYDVIYGRTDRIEIIKPVLEESGLDFNPTIIMAIVFDDFWNYCVNKDNRERQSIKREMMLCCKRSLSDNYKAITATLTGTDKLAVALDTGNSTGSDAEDYALECALRIKDSIKIELGYSCSIGVSHYCNNSNYLWRAYEEAFNALQNGFFLGHSQIMLYDRATAMKRKRHKTSEFQSAKEELILALGQEDVERCKQSVNLLMNALMNEGADMNDVRSTFIVNMSTITDYAHQMGLPPDLLSQKLLEVVTKISVSNTSQEVIEIATEFLLGLLGEKVEVKPKGMEGSIAEARAYIKMYHSAPLTLSSVAAVFGYNAAYFSRNFKKYSNITFSEYLQNVRIDGVKEYLENSTLSISEIAEKTGFQNRNYMTKVFIDKTGKTPVQWRKQI